MSINKLYFGFRADELRMDSRAADNKKIKANFLFGGFIASSLAYRQVSESWCVNEQLCFVSIPPEAGCANSPK